MEIVATEDDSIQREGCPIRHETFLHACMRGDPGVSHASD